jgi:hypothetical protein
MRRKPLEVLAATALHLADRNPSRARKILGPVKRAMTAYDKFLRILSHPSERKHLEKLSQEAMDSDRLFRNARSISHEFRDGIDEFFFDCDVELAKLTRHYGVF